MKRASQNKLVVVVLAVFLLFGINLLAGTKAVKIAQKSPLSAENNFTFEIIAGQYIPVGMLEVWSDQGYIFVRYQTFDNWYLTETHLHLAMDWRQIPQNRNGNPIPGHFAYQMEHSYVNEYTYQIPLNDGKGIPPYGAAHCKVVKIENGKPVQEETGWARNKVPPYRRFPGNNWAYYFEMRN
jgi:hypothetical protein|uniref:Uncharacterized protein n=1 Tax=candidate division WOR-3 bacterium TaxID=2052148 RepID=A0A7C6A9T6_UNCW3